jgi:hypothetical protein
MRTGGSRYVPQQRSLDVDERLVAPRIYRRRNRRALQAVMGFLGYPYDGSEAGLAALAEVVVMVAFRPSET